MFVDSFKLEILKVPQKAGLDIFTHLHSGKLAMIRSQDLKIIKQLM